jgi:hypothetical protein
MVVKWAMIPDVNEQRSRVCTLELPPCNGWCNGKSSASDRSRDPCPPSDFDRGLRLRGEQQRRRRRAAARGGGEARRPDGWAVRRNGEDGVGQWLCQRCGGVGEHRSWALGVTRDRSFVKPTINNVHELFLRLVIIHSREVQSHRPTS